MHRVRIIAAMIAFVVASVPSGAEAQPFCPTTCCPSRCTPRCPLGFPSVVSPNWAQYELLLYRANGYRVPPLVTTSPAATPVNNVGVLQMPRTQTLVGEDEFGDRLRTGGRVTLGRWIDSYGSTGIQFELFGLGDGGDRIFSSDPGGTIIARPYDDTSVDNSGPAAEIVNMDGVAQGSVDIDSSSRVFSFAPSLRLASILTRNGQFGAQTRMDALFGYRLLQAQESLRISEQFSPDNGLFPVGTEYAFNDKYQTANTFHGGEIGLDWQRVSRRFSLQALGKVALGSLTRTVDVDGSSRVFVPGAVDSQFDSGFYTPADRQGRSTDSSFAVVPELRLQAGYFVNRNLQVFAGYDVLFLGSVVRPGSQIDQRIDPASLLTDATPPRTVDRAHSRENLWLHGASLGLAFSY